MGDTAKIVGGLIAIIVLVPLLFLWGSYNSLVSLDIQCDQEWSQVQVQYQRRYDLIPRIVNSTKMYLNYEKNLLMEITQARTAWTKALQSGSLESQMDSGETLGGIAGRLLAMLTVEAYPDLKGNQVVLTLIDELEGTENRIAVARGRYVEAVANYNRGIRVFPTNFVAGMFGFYPRLSYKADTGASTVPRVPA